MLSALKNKDWAFVLSISAKKIKVMIGILEVSSLDKKYFSKFGFR
jgi:hypothetical protein